MVGHFPVLFQSKDEHSFTVNKPEQAKIMEKVTDSAVNETLCNYHLRPRHGVGFDLPGIETP